MSQRKETQSNQPSNKTKSKSLFTPLDQQEQQTPYWRLGLEK